MAGRMALEPGEATVEDGWARGPRRDVLTPLCHSPLCAQQGIRASPHVFQTFKETDSALFASMTKSAQKPSSKLGRGGSFLSPKQPRKNSSSVEVPTGQVVEGQGEEP